jgi:hypothetical protein
MTPSSVVRGVALLMAWMRWSMTSASRQLGGFEGRPLGEEIAEDGGVFVVEPWEDVREVVLQGTGQAIREAHVVADQTAAMVAKLFEGTHGGALGLEGLELVAMLAQELKLECRVRGIVLGVAGSEGFAVLGQGQRIDGEQDEERVWPQGLDQRAFVEFEAHRHRASCKPLVYGLCPRVDGLWFVLESTELPGVRADGLSADIGFGIGPLDTNEGSTRLFW